VSSSADMQTGMGEGHVVGGPTPQWLNVKEAADYVRCHEETIRRGYLSGHLKAMAFGARGRRILISDLENWMRNGARTQ
jgi:excisionase family DNA binding protein